MQYQLAPAQETPKLLFVVGLWRSGTSLIHVLLNGHPQVALLYEAEPLVLWPRHPLFPSPDWAQRLEFFNQTFSRHKLDPKPFASIKPGPSGALALYREYARTRNAVVMGGKAPSYSTKLPLLQQLFPDASFLIIWRDPIECCRSAAHAARQNRFFAQRGMSDRILLEAETFARGVEVLLREKCNVCQVVYDELVENPESQLRRVCDFLKIPFSPAMLDLKSADKSALPPGAHHEGVRSGVIGKTSQAEEILPAALVAKGSRYAQLWKKQFPNLCFVRALPDDAVAPPGFVERLGDYFVRKFWRAVDRFKVMLFRRIPMSIWLRLRSRPRK